MYTARGGAGRDELLLCFQDDDSVVRHRLAGEQLPCRTIPSRQPRHAVWAASVSCSHARQGGLAGRGGGGGGLEVCTRLTELTDITELSSMIGIKIFSKSIIEELETVHSHGSNIKLRNL